MIVFFVFFFAVKLYKKSVFLFFVFPPLFSLESSL